ncbi:MAG: type II secretion system protein GspM, partial [bacterium]
MNALMQRLIDAWSGISAREQMLVGVAVGLTILSILFVGIVQPIIGLSTTVASRVDAAEQELLAMNRLRRQYDIVNTSLSKVEERILSNYEKRNLLTLLESLAAASSV